MPAWPLLPPASRRCVATARVLYARILERIEAADYDVFSSRARVPTAAKAALAARMVASRDPVGAGPARPGGRQPPDLGWVSDDPVVLVDETGAATGTAPKSSVHHDDTPLHLAFSCYVVDDDGRLLVTTRATSKPSFPGVLTNTVCGHPLPGEDLDAAVRRRARDELGVEVGEVRLVLPRFRYRAVQGAIAENEVCPVFLARAARPRHRARPGGGRRRRLGPVVGVLRRRARRTAHRLAVVRRAGAAARGPRPRPARLARWPPGRAAARRPARRHRRGPLSRWTTVDDRYQYLLLMAGCLLITLPLEFVLRARVYRRPVRLLAALLPVVIVFSVWDVVGIVRDHWTYAPEYTTGILLPLEMPLEELVFFVVIPICGLLTYEAVGTVLGWLRRWRERDA